MCSLMKAAFATESTGSLVPHMREKVNIANGVEATARGHPHAIPWIPSAEQNALS